MDEKYTILIADRNSHVRSFLGRELKAEGYQIRLAENGQQVIHWAYHHEPLDLIILDPDLPGSDERILFKRLHDRIPSIPVVVHSFQNDDDGDNVHRNDTIFVEKRGNSVERLKEVVAEILLSKRSQ